MDGRRALGQGPLGLLGQLGLLRPLRPLRPLGPLNENRHPEGGTTEGSLFRQTDAVEILRLRLRMTALSVAPVASVASVAS